MESSAAVVVRGGQAQITDSTLLGQIGLWAEREDGSPSVQAHRLTITSSGSTDAAAVVAQGGTVTIDESLLALTAGAAGLQVEQSMGHSAS